LFASDVAEAAKLMAAHPARPGLLIVDQPAGATSSLLDYLKHVRCPALALVPFGRLPLPPREPREAGVVLKPIKNAVFYQEVARLFAQEKKAETVEALEESQLATELPLKVLLAEDNVVNQKVALGLLRRLGYQADLASDGAQAVAMLEKQPYDLILMDLQMPNMDGLEASREIRRRMPTGRHPIIVALTANALQGDRDRCLAAGMNDYIAKPVKLNDLAAAIRRQCGRAGRPAKPAG
jgi:CheY-like chemotaxis protein